MDRTCKSCGNDEFEEIEALETSYPDRKKDRDQTVRRVLRCTSCGSEGRIFEDGESGVVTYSGVLRA